jgi:hypothetical protein
MSNFKKLVQARVEKTGESWSTASRHVRGHAVASVPAMTTMPAMPDGPVWILPQVSQGTRRLFERHGVEGSFEVEVNSYRIPDDRIGPNGRVPTLPRGPRISFVEEPPGKWRFDGILVFMAGELYDGREPLRMDLLASVDGRRRVAEVIEESVRNENTWFSKRLTRLAVSAGDQRGDNLRFLVSLTVEDPTSAMLRELRAVHPSSVLVGRIPAVGRSATAAVAERHARELAETPKYFADSGHVQKTITHDDLVELVERGATEKGGVQRILVSRPDTRMTAPSVRCAHCHRWLWCDEEREGACYCGKRHEVIFDGAPDWSLPMGERCMDCGLEHTYTQPHEQRNPWRLTGERQVSCALCTHTNAGPRWGTG